MYILHAVRFALLLAIVLAQEVPVNKILHATRLRGHTMKTIVTISVNKCHKECRLRSDCLSFSYNRFYRICELHDYVNDIGSNIDIQEEKGWVYMSVRRTSLNDLESCNGMVCPNGKVCRDGKCVTERCAPTRTITVANGTMLGNMNNVESKVLTVCNAGFHVIGTDSAECLADGSWSILATCEKVCLAPQLLQTTYGYPTIMSANISSPNGLLSNVNLINGDIIVREGSEVTYNCAGGSYLQTYQRIFCHDGNWMYMPGCEELQLEIDCFVHVACSVLPHSDECVNRICRCPLGTSYSYSEMRCIEKCPGAYANTFNEVKGVGQLGYDIQALSTTRINCQMYCIDALFTCRSFDFDYNRNRCYLQTITFHDDTTAIDVWDNGAHCQRDCL